MSNQNWQLQEGDVFAPAALDTLEHLPSHHCEQPEIDPRFAAAHYGHDLKPSITDIKARLRTKTPNVWLMMRIAEDAAQHIAMLESESEQLRMSVHNARIELAEAGKDAARYQWLRYADDSQLELVRGGPPDDRPLPEGEEFDKAIDAAMKEQA